MAPENKTPSIEHITKKIFRYIDKMPGLSPTVSKLLDVANNMNSSAPDLIKVIKTDAILTSKVLKLINSSYFGFDRQISSLGRALILLGINTIKNLALSSAVAGMFSQQKKIHGFDIEDLWRHSLACAVASRLIAHHINIPQKSLEEFFISGLLHDIGKILLIYFCSLEFKEIIEQAEITGKRTLDLEVNKFGLNHADIGGLLALRWRFSEPLQTAISLHHDPPLADDFYSPTAAVIHVADIFCNRLNIGFRSDKSPVVIKKGVLDKLSLKKKDIVSVFEQVPEEIVKASIFLKT